ncbi:O-antigen ligase family protein [Sphingomonas sp.]|uniref:O-antigen ligase family protein n=1 Tax=Sphingomonas sp. TaxID=28214 RepID=UPI0025D1698F|nr:O-antigen ligase family protein [Sphingomonas sp.]
MNPKVAPQGADFAAPGLPMSVQLPLSVLLFVLLLYGLRKAGSTSARYVVFACWMRFMLSSYHIYTFKHVVGPISGTALGSAGLFVLGILLLPKRLLLSKVLLPIYVILAAIGISALVNHVLLTAFEPMTKFGLAIALAMHTYRALRNGDPKKFVLSLLVSFAPLLVFQIFSIILHVPKASEGEGSAAYIGGYYHEAAFSIALIALLIMIALTRAIPRWIKFVTIPLIMLSIVLANYRTAILAAFPLIIYYTLYAINRPVDRRLRGMIAILAGVGVVVAGGLALMTLDRFKDLQVVLQSGTSLIKPPSEFGNADRELLSGRFQIWSEYLYMWKAAPELRHLVGFGPESWEQYFDLYAHNSFVDYLFEYGILGVVALAGMFISGLVVALRSQQDRWKLVAAHLCFIILNLATMPLWLIEGNIVFGLLWGYTLYYSRGGKTITVQARPRPQLKAVSI